MFINKVIYLFGCKKRNPSLFGQYKELKKTEKYSREKLQKLQMLKLQKLLEIAYNNTEYYRGMFDNLGLLPEDISNLDDLSKIPILEKKTIIEHGEKLRNFKIKDVFKSETSGSTGEPLIFYRNEKWESAGRAAQLRGYSWYGVKPWDRNGYLWGHLYGSKFQFKTRVLDMLLNRFRMFSYSPEDIKIFSKKLKKAKYIEGYSSMIYEVAKQINKGHDKPYKIKMVKGTSEKIFDSYQDEVSKAFGQKMISEYGAAETSLIAFECPAGNMHVAMENVIVEVENGEILVTNLNSFSMPIIRYKLGDSITLDRNKRCTCGMEHEIITDIVGRIGKNIYGVEGKYPSLTLYYIFKSLALKTGYSLSYQAIQHERGKLQLLFERVTNEDEKKSILQECYNYFKDDISVEICDEKLVRNHSKKFQDFVTDLN